MSQHVPILPLRDVIAPPAIGWWPPAPGWWLVFALLLLLLIYLVRLLVKRLTPRYRALRKSALGELDELQRTEGLNDSQFVGALSAVLKRVAVLRYPQQQTAGLNGEGWLAYLDQSGAQPAFAESGGEALLDAHYRRSATVAREPLFAAARAWVKTI